MRLSNECTLEYWELQSSMDIYFFFHAVTTHMNSREQIPKADC